KRQRIQRGATTLNWITASGVCRTWARVPPDKAEPATHPAGVKPAHLPQARAVALDTARRHQAGEGGWRKWPTPLLRARRLASGLLREGGEQIAQVRVVGDVLGMRRNQFEDDLQGAPSGAVMVANLVPVVG